MTSSQTVKLNANDLMKRASTQTGLSDFGDMWFARPLRAVVGMINAEASLTSLSCAPVQTLVDNLANRLRLVDYLKRHPEVYDENVEVVGIIIAHARGGSTLLQRLLTASPKLTAPRWWELIAPVPLDDEETGQPAERLKIANEWIDAVNRASPDHGAIHPIEAMAYEEEIMLINHSFMSMMYSSYFNLPTNQLWQMEQDHARSYEELKLWLKLLQHQDPSRRGRKWLLKSVQHLMTGHLQTVIDAFPNTKLIMTHRKLESVLASLCSAQAMLIRASDPWEFDPRGCGPAALDMYETALRRLVDIRRDAPDELFVDVQYDDLVADPFGQFERVFQAIGLTVEPADASAVRQWIAENPRGNFPAHRYRLEDYGLSTEAIAERLSFYTDSVPA